MARKPRRPPDLESNLPETPPAAAATAPSPRLILAALAGMVAAWLAAGSMGLLAHPLRHALVWLALAVVLLAGWPQGRRTGREWGILAAALLAGLILTMPATGVYNVLGVALVLAVLARRPSDGSCPAGGGKGDRHLLPERPHG